MGRIAAGTPIEAIQTRSHTINVPPDMLSTGEHFALEVRGDSMIEAGILDGDTVLIRKTEAADTGDIVVALIDDEEATLKRFRRRGASIALEPANTRLRGPHPAAEPRAHPGQAGRAVPEVLSSFFTPPFEGRVEIATASGVTQSSADTSSVLGVASRGASVTLPAHRLRRASSSRRAHGQS